MKNLGDQLKIVDRWQTKKRNFGKFENTSSDIFGPIAERSFRYTPDNDTEQTTYTWKFDRPESKNIPLSSFQIYSHRKDS